jgi:hypothetical protein|tara:strand:- start:752 stop:949 length:198 start_codon:yes stop_codon:yes gene_type:complete
MKKKDLSIINDFNSVDSQWNDMSIMDEPDDGLDMFESMRAKQRTVDEHLNDLVKYLIQDTKGSIH